MLFFVLLFEITIDDGLAIWSPSQGTPHARQATLRNVAENESVEIRLDFITCSGNHPSPNHGKINR